MVVKQESVVIRFPREEEFPNPVPNVWMDDLGSLITMGLDSSVWFYFIDMLNSLVDEPLSLTIRVNNYHNPYIVEEACWKILESYEVGLYEAGDDEDIALVDYLVANIDDFYLYVKRLVDEFINHVLFPLTNYLLNYSRSTGRTPEIHTVEDAYDGLWVSILV